MNRTDRINLMSAQMLIRIGEILVIPGFSNSILSPLSQSVNCEESWIFRYLLKLSYDMGIEEFDSNNNCRISLFFCHSSTISHLNSKLLKNTYVQYKITHFFFTFLISLTVRNIIGTREEIRGITGQILIYSMIR